MAFRVWAGVCLPYLACFWHFWLATVQDVLQADWQEAWHSPQPVFAEALMQGFSMVTICFIKKSSNKSNILL